MTPEQVREIRLRLLYDASASEKGVAFMEDEDLARETAENVSLIREAISVCSAWLLQQKVVDAAQRYLDVLKDPSSPPAVRQGAIDALAASLSPAASPDEGEKG